MRNIGDDPLINWPLNDIGTVETALPGTYNISTSGTVQSVMPIINGFSNAQQAITTGGYISVDSVMLSPNRSSYDSAFEFFVQFEAPPNNFLLAKSSLWSLVIDGGFMNLIYNRQNSQVGAVIAQTDLRLDNLTDVMHIVVNHSQNKAYLTVNGNTASTGLDSELVAEYAGTDSAVYLYGHDFYRPTYSNVSTYSKLLSTKKARGHYFFYMTDKKTNRLAGAFNGTFANMSQEHISRPHRLRMDYKGTWNVIDRSDITDTGDGLTVSNIRSYTRVPSWDEYAISDSAVDILSEVPVSQINNWLATRAEFRRNKHEGEFGLEDAVPASPWEQGLFSNINELTGTTSSGTTGANSAFQFATATNGPGLQLANVYECNITATHSEGLFRIDFPTVPVNSETGEYRVSALFQLSDATNSFAITLNNRTLVSQTGFGDTNWVLFVAYINPGSESPDPTLYDERGQVIVTGTRANAFLAGGETSITIRLRASNPSSTTTLGEFLRVAYPRIDYVDGDEPAEDALLSNVQTYMTLQKQNTATYSFNSRTVGTDIEWYWSVPSLNGDGSQRDLVMFTQAFSADPEENVVFAKMEHTGDSMTFRAHGYLDKSQGSNSYVMAIGDGFQYINAGGKKQSIRLGAAMYSDHTINATNQSYCDKYLGYGQDFNSESGYDRIPPLRKFTDYLDGKARSGKFTVRIPARRLSPYSDTIAANEFVFDVPSALPDITTAKWTGGSTVYGSMPYLHNSPAGEYRKNVTSITRTYNNYIGASDQIVYFAWRSAGPTRNVTVNVTAKPFGLSPITLYNGAFAGKANSEWQSTVSDSIALANTKYEYVTVTVSFSSLSDVAYIYFGDESVNSPFYAWYSVVNKATSETVAGPYLAGNYFSFSELNGADISQYDIFIKCTLSGNTSNGSMPVVRSFNATGHEQLTWGTKSGMQFISQPSSNGFNVPPKYFDLPPLASPYLGGQVLAGNTLTVDYSGMVSPDGSVINAIGFFANIPSAQANSMRLFRISNSVQSVECIVSAGSFSFAGTVYANGSVVTRPVRGWANYLFVPNGGVGTIDQAVTITLGNDVDACFTMDNMYVLQKDVTATDAMEIHKSMLDVNNVLVSDDETLNVIVNDRSESGHSAGGVEERLYQPSPTQTNYIGEVDLVFDIINTPSRNILSDTDFFNPGEWLETANQRVFSGSVKTVGVQGTIGPGAIQVVTPPYGGIHCSTKVVPQTEYTFSADLKFVAGGVTIPSTETWDDTDAEWGDDYVDWFGRSYSSPGEVAPAIGAATWGDSTVLWQQSGTSWVGQRQSGDSSTWGDSNVLWQQNGVSWTGQVQKPTEAALYIDYSGASGTGTQKYPLSFPDSDWKSISVNFGPLDATRIEVSIVFPAGTVMMDNPKLVANQISNPLTDRIIDFEQVVSGQRIIDLTGNGCFEIQSGAAMTPVSVSNGDYVSVKRGAVYSGEHFVLESGVWVQRNGIQKYSFSEIMV